jgi:hypothetical protein
LPFLQEEVPIVIELENCISRKTYDWAGGDLFEKQWDLKRVKILALSAGALPAAARTMDRERRLS